MTASRAKSCLVVAVVLLILAATLLERACAAGPSTLRIVNRTQVPVVVAFGDSSLVVGACSERSVEDVEGVWGGDGSGLRHVEAAPAGAYVLRQPRMAQQPAAEGQVEAVLAVTSSYIGYRHATGAVDNVVGTPFPPDPAAVVCSGSPPPTPGSAP